jgi:hypothetical protein
MSGVEAGVGMKTLWMLIVGMAAAVVGLATLTLRTVK